MGGRKREWVCECMCVSVMGSEGEREGAWAIGRLRSIVALHPTDNSEHFRIIVHGTYPAKVLQSQAAGFRRKMRVREGWNLAPGEKFEKKLLVKAATSLKNSCAVPKSSEVLMYKSSFC